MLPAPLHYLATCAGIMVQHNEESANSGAENPPNFEFNIEGEERKAREWTEEEGEGEEHPLKVVFKLRTEVKFIKILFLLVYIFRDLKG